MISPRSFLVSSRRSQGPSHLQPRRPAVGSLSHTSTFSPSSTSSKRYEDRFAVDTDSTASNSSLAMSAALQRPGEDGFGSRTPSAPRSEMMQSRSTTPSTPVQIPTRPKSRDPAHSAHPQKLYRSHGGRRNYSMPRSRDAHSRDAIPASVAALLAVTSIPPPKAARSPRQTKTEKRMTVESIIEKAQESEKELSLTLSKSPLDILLMAPEDLEADDASICDSIPDSVLSARTISMESMPSLSNSFTTDNTFSSLESPHTPLRRRKIQPTRRSMEPVSSPPGEPESHPLSSSGNEVADLDLGVFGGQEEAPDRKASRLPFSPLKSVFKSNLTASLRALRQAARSFSNLNFSSIPPEDFLTRSILTIDPQVPYTDERRPPPLEEEPTAALRRYLNPTTTARMEKPAPVASGPALRTFTASIQMQTYKIHRARSSSPSSGRSPYPSIGPSSTATAAASQPPQPKPVVTEHPMPGPRQREMRENPDFIRIAVMEMAMRKSGKLDDQRPGRARWALPPRKANSSPYEIGPDGVPARWVAVTH